jgi:hypothetical protein
VRIEVHLKTLDEVAAVQEHFAGTTDEIVIIVAAVPPAPAATQERKQAVGER